MHQRLADPRGHGPQRQRRGDRGVSAGYGEQDQAGEIGRFS